MWATEVTTTYVFTSMDWKATCNDVAANWTSGKDGAGFSNNGIQVTTNATGANGTSPVSFTNVTKIVATYNTNKSKGAGSIVAQIGSNAETTNSVAYSGSANGTTANFTTEFNYTTPQSGNVKLTVNTTTNSIYLVSVAITTSSSSTPTCATPTFSPTEGTYTSTQNVTISTTTDGATIYYTTDGNDPTTSSSVYSSAIPVSSTTTIKAMAVKADYDNSAVASATYTIKTDPALAFSSATAEAAIGQAFTAPTLTNSYDVAVTWTSSDENVATVSGGTVTLVGEGTTTITASFAGDATYIASEASYTLTVTDPSAITLWSEDFSSYSADAVPSGGTYSYACTNGSNNGTTKIYADNLAGGTSPELLVAKSSGTFTAVVPLNNASGTLTLAYKTNAQSLTVSTTTEGITGGDNFSTAGEHTVTFTGVTTSMTSITIVFTAGSSNVRLDDIVLRGNAQAATVEAPTFSVNGGTYYAAQSVELSCATDGATIYYTTNGVEPTSSSTVYSSAITVSETMTIKAIAIKGSDQSTVSSATYTIAEKNNVVFSITDKSLAYGETYTVTKATYSGRDIQSDGFVTVSSNNVAVASVDGMIITANAVGTATITLSVAEGDTYKAGETTITVTVTAPAGQTTAPEVPALFNETFDKCDGTGGRDNTFTGSVGTSSTTGKLDESWTTIGSNGAKQCIKLGTGSASGTVTTSNIALTGNGTLTFSAAGWGDVSTNKVTVTATGATLSGDTEVTMSNGEWNNYSVNITDAEGAVAITFSMKRGFLDDVKVVEEGAAAPTATVTLSSTGYATYCSPYPLDFSGNDHSKYRAWYVSGIDNTTVTFSEITGKVKGGTPIILYGTPNATCELASADSENELDGNMLVGTLAPTWVNQESDGYTNYALSASHGDFRKIPSAGMTFPVNKAYLPVPTSVTPSSRMAIVFNDVTTGIKSMDNGQWTMDNTIYDLQGRRVETPRKGSLYIMNGKKVVF